jgi:hypothetical protein
MTYKRSAFVFMASLAIALGIIIVRPGVANRNVPPDRVLAESSELAIIQLSPVRLVISGVR